MRNTTTNMISLCRSSRNNIRNNIWKLVICSVCFFLTGKVNGQFSTDSSVLDVSKVQSAETINQSVFYTTYKKNALTDKDIAKLNISQKIPASFEKRIPLKTIGENIYLKFPLYNGSDTTVQVYFFPGLY